MPWSCAFCGRSDERTREHLIRDQWEGRFPTTTGVVREVERLDKETEYTPIPRSVFEQPIREVCGPCNSKWMNAIDTAAEPVALKLANGVAVQTTPEQEAALQRWAVKTALVRTLFDRSFEKPFALMHAMAEDTAQVPAGAFAQVALCSELAPYSGGRNVPLGLSFSPTSISDDTNVWFVAICLGHLYAQVGLTSGRAKHRTHVLDRLRTVRRSFGGGVVFLDANSRHAKWIGRDVRLSAQAIHETMDFVAGRLDPDDPRPVPNAVHLKPPAQRSSSS